MSSRRRLPESLRIERGGEPSGERQEAAIRGSNTKRENVRRTIMEESMTRNHHDQFYTLHTFNMNRKDHHHHHETTEGRRQAGK